MAENIKEISPDSETENLNNNTEHLVPENIEIKCRLWKLGERLNFPTPKIILDHDTHFLLDPPDEEEKNCAVVRLTEIEQIKEIIEDRGNVYLRAPVAGIEQIKKIGEDRGNVETITEFTIDYKNNLKVEISNEIYIEVNNNIKSQLEEIKKKIIEESKKRKEREILEGTDKEEVNGEEKNRKNKEWLPYKDEDIPIGGRDKKIS